jgi:Protein of unknown function (DUF2510)
LRIAGKSLMLIGAAIYLVALARLHYYSEAMLGSYAGGTLWDITTREPAILSAIAGIVALCALLGFFSEELTLSGLAMALSFLLLGQSISFGMPDYSVFGVGYWVCGGAALTMSIGGLFALSGYVPRDRRSLPAAVPATPAAGWYQDPAAEARQRYWTGATWTEHTR